MILKDIANEIEMDISTISRVANSKYVDTPYGTKLLKEFFSESMKTVSGEEISTIEIKKILENIKNEPKIDPRHLLPSVLGGIRKGLPLLRKERNTGSNKSEQVRNKS